MSKRVLKNGRSKILYVTDLDGTLMHDNKKISEYTVNTINRYIEQGMMITYATARSFESAWEITKHINFRIPVITRNGTVLADQLERREIDFYSFSTNEIVLLKSILDGVIDTLGFVTSYFDNIMTKTYRDVNLSSGFQKYVDEHKNDGRMRAVGMKEDIFDGVVTYVTLIADKEELIPIYRKIKGLGRWECVFQKDKYGDEFWLEIFPQNATKAKAVLRCKEMLNCDEVVVFGDSLNDLSMFRVADKACAVANAMDEVKELSTVVIQSNNNDGVAKYLSENWK